MNSREVNKVIANYETYVNPALARLFRLAGQAAVEVSAEGMFVRDSAGNEYLDCLGGYGVFGLGHRHPAVVRAVKKQLDEMPLSSKLLFSKPLADLCCLLAEIVPGNLQYSFVCNSGAEAVEGALKLARLYTGRSKIVAMDNAFHGKTLGALSATGRPVFTEPFHPLLPGFQHIPYGNAVAAQAAVDTRTAAVLVEPIQGEGGVVVPPDGYLKELRRICDDAGALLICDEIQTGLGRTGKMFAVEYEEVVPDILLIAKALGGGIMPIGAFCASAEVWEPFIQDPLLHTSTFGGNPLACAAAVAAIHVLQEEDLPQRAFASGEVLRSELACIAMRYPEVIREVRGKGLLLGLEFFCPGTAGLFMNQLLRKKILAAYTLNNPHVIRLEPPLVIDMDSVGRIIEVVAAAAAAIQPLVKTEGGW